MIDLLPVPGRQISGTTGGLGKPMPAKPASVQGCNQLRICAYCTDPVWRSDPAYSKYVDYD